MSGIGWNSFLHKLHSFELTHRVRFKNAEHKAEPVSSNPPSPKEGAEKGREEEQNRAAESPPKRKLTRTHKLHLKAPAASTSSSSSCCRYYYGHYCSNARWSRTWRKRRSRKLALKRRSTEMIKTKLFAYMLRWFSFFSSKQCQVCIWDINLLNWGIKFSVFIFFFLWQCFCHFEF